MSPSVTPDFKPRLLVNPATGKRSWRHIIGLSLLAVAALLIAALSIAFLIVNLRVAIEYPFTVNETAVKAASEQAPDTATPVTLWGQTVLTLRRWSVDKSAMTPFKLSLFFTYLFAFSVRSLSGRISSQDLHGRARSLPFFDTLETTLVQLGMAGTIYGFLLIGWRLSRSGIDLAKDTTPALQILLDGFGTALLSTFTGVVLAYICAPLLRRLWVWLHALRPVTISAANLQAAVRQLSHALINNVAPTGALATTFTAARKPTEELTESIITLATTIEVVRSNLERRGTLDELERWGAEIAAAAQSVVQALGDVTPAASSLTNQVAGLSTLIQKLADNLARRKPLARIQNRLDQTVQTLREIQKVLGTIEATAKAEAASLARIETTTAKLREAATTVGSAINGVRGDFGHLIKDSVANAAILGEILVVTRQQMQLQSTTNELLRTSFAQLKDLSAQLKDFSVAHASRPCALLPPPVRTVRSGKDRRWWALLWRRRQ